MLCLTEQGLYFFLARSDKPKALPFQKWLAGDVLPSIRKTGSYSLAQLTEVERRSLDYIPGATKRAALKSLIDLVRDNPERAAHLEADLVRILLVLAPSQGQMEEWEQGEPSLVTLFWKACEKLHDMGVTINHGDTPGQLHLDLEEVYELTLKHLCHDDWGKSYRHPLGFQELTFSHLKLVRKLPDSAQYPLREKAWRFFSKRTGEEIRPCWIFEDKRGRFKQSALTEG